MRTTGEGWHRDINFNHDQIMAVMNSAVDGVHDNGKSTVRAFKETMTIQAAKPMRQESWFAKVAANS